MPGCGASALAAHRDSVLRYGDDRKIALKKAVLINRQMPIINLPYIL